MPEIKELKGTWNFTFCIPVNFSDMLFDKTISAVVAFREQSIGRWEPTMTSTF